MQEAWLSKAELWVPAMKRREALRFHVLAAADRQLRLAPPSNVLAFLHLPLQPVKLECGYGSKHMEKKHPPES